MKDYYCTIKEIRQLSSLLQDDLSHDIFWARLRNDTQGPSLERFLSLYGLTEIPTAEEITIQREWKKEIDLLRNREKKIFLYGAGGYGYTVANIIWRGGSDFFGFCDRNFARYPKGFLDKPVCPPKYLFENSDDCYVIITAIHHMNEMLELLKQGGFPTDHILPYFSMVGAAGLERAPRQYFEFPQLFQRGTAFVDAGAFDGADTKYFIDWCGGDYSKVLVFEPDVSNFERCRNHLAGAERVELYRQGLGEKSGWASFVSSLACSRIVETKEEDSLEKIELAALDDLTKDCRVGFIKMDIEGAELAALSGARETILRDKPLLAICVYHKPGDVLAVMDYLDSLRLGYRFWLRHYSFSNAETVLYAAP